MTLLYNRTVLCNNILRGVMNMDKNELKKLLCEAVDSVKDQTKAFADDVAAHA